MIRTLLPAFALLIFAGCAQPNEYQPPPPPEVTVAKPLVRTVTNYLEETGTTQPVDRVEIRARVNGFLESIEFEEGGEVTENQVLYTIQQDEYIANRDAAAAEIAALQAALELTEADLGRERELEKRDATTKANIDLAVAKRNAAKAALDAGQAALAQSELDLNYTKVVTPIAGRVERTLVKRGNFVSGSPTTHLTTVVKYDPIHVYFNISERALLNVVGSEKASVDERPDISSIPAQVGRATDIGYPLEGHLDYADLGVNESTGTFTIRAVFPNPNLQLFPGLFVRIRFPLGTIEDAILVPESATASDQAGRYVMVLGPENVVERRNIILGAKHGEMVIVREGLKPDESVIVDGLLRARPGVTVKATESTLSFEEEALPRGDAAAQNDPETDGSDNAGDDEAAADSDE